MSETERSVEIVDGWRYEIGTVEVKESDPAALQLEEIFALGFGYSRIPNQSLEDAGQFGFIRPFDRKLPFPRCHARVVMKGDHLSSIDLHWDREQHITGEGYPDAELGRMVELTDRDPFFRQTRLGRQTSENLFYQLLARRFGYEVGSLDHKQETYRFVRFLNSAKDSPRLGMEILSKNGRMVSLSLDYEVDGTKTTLHNVISNETRRLMAVSAEDPLFESPLGRKIFRRLSHQQLFPAHDHKLHTLLEFHVSHPRQFHLREQEEREMEQEVVEALSS